MNKSNLRSALISAAFIVGCAAFATSARADNSKVVVSFDEAFSGETTIDGTFTVGGEFHDTGARHEDFTVQVVGNHVIVSGTIKCTGAKGVFTETFLGTIDSASHQKTYINGFGTFTGGTGIYKGLLGNATFIATIDFGTGKIVGVTTGQLSLPDAPHPAP